MNVIQAQPAQQSPSFLRVSALTQGVRQPSTRFRVEQHIDALTRHGIEIEHIPAYPGAYPPVSRGRRVAWLPQAVLDAALRVQRTSDSDICLLQRELVSTLHTAERLISRPIVFDVDDAIFIHQRYRSIDKIAKQARLITCGNTFLADYFSAHGRVEILPTAVDSSRFMPAVGLIDRPVIGWSGSSSVFAYLESIQEPLRIVLDRFPDAVFSVIADRPPMLARIPIDRMLFIPWSENTEVQGLQSFTVGIMPLTDTPWSRGKCSFKMLTYMAVGLPVVVSPVGMNLEVLRLGDCGFAASSDDDWVDTLTTLLSDRDRSACMGLTGRRIIDSYYSLDVIAPRLATLLRSVS
jgi:glycosyltransferase involved in cell wall biosynthesis